MLKLPSRYEEQVSLGSCIPPPRSHKMPDPFRSMNPFMILCLVTWNLTGERQVDLGGELALRLVACNFGLLL